MDATSLDTVNDLSSVVAIFRKGASALANWHARKRDANYREFIRAAMDGQVFPENGSAMRPEDLYSILQALESDLEEQKAAMYGVLACAIALGKVAGPEKRHFIKALQALTYDQMEALKRARVASMFELWPHAGAGRVEESEFLPTPGRASIDEATYRQFALADSGKLTEVGRRFVDSCFAATEIQPKAIGHRTWMRGHVHIFCHELSEDRLSSFVNNLTMAAHGEAIKVTNSSMQPNQVGDVRLYRPSMIVLLYRDLDKVPGRLDVVSSAKDLFGARAIEVSLGAFGGGNESTSAHAKFSLSDDGDSHVVEMIIAEFKASAS